MMKAVIGIGTNIGNKLNNIKDSVSALGHLPGTKVEKISYVYETEPWGFTEQDNFYNVCVLVETELSPKALLGACLGIEAAFGRERPFKNSPRVLDMDLLLYENTSMNERELAVPHPLIGERAFVLVPLKDILPDLIFDEYNYAECYEKCNKNEVKKVFDIKI